MKGRVLTVDAASSKATLTLKRTMLRDKREPVSCYDDVSYGDGRSCSTVASSQEYDVDYVTCCAC